jgi:5'-nucleotidase
MKGFLVVTLAVLLAACEAGEPEGRVVVVSTNDMHASIEAFPRLATLVDSLRAEVGEENVLLVDAGDRWTGNPFVDLASPPLRPIVELMNELGYDVATVGNHEFDWGQELLAERLAEMNFPVVCANIERGDGAVLGEFPPYAVIERGGMKFAFLGLVTNFSRWNRPVGKAEHFIGLTFPDVYETAEKYASLADSADVFVGLVHLGHESELELAERLPELDLIIGGDSHTVVEDAPLVGKTLVTQAGSGLKYAGGTTVTRRDGEISIENSLVELATLPPSPRFEEMVERYKANPELLAPIGAVAEPFGKHGVDNLVVSSMREAVGADVALYHEGGIRIDTLYGAVSTADMFRIEPFLSEVYTLHMTPGQIKGLIMSKFNNADDKESHGPDLVPDGFRYTIETDEAGEAVDVRFDAPERASYFVAIPDYVYKNYVFDRSEEGVETDILITDILREYVKENSPVLPDNEGRIAIE